jgi:hypothetical protein
MSKRQWAFRPAVLTRAIKAAEKAGNACIQQIIDGHSLCFLSAQGLPIGQRIPRGAARWPVARGPTLH